MRKACYWICILTISLLLLSACKIANGNNEESSDNKDRDEIPSANTPVEDPVEYPKNDIDEYLLASGMVCIEKLDQVFSDFKSASSQIESTVRAFRENETFSAVLVPFQTNEVTEMLHLNISGYYEYLPEYLNAYALHNLFYWSYTDMDTYDIDEWTCFSSVSSHIAIPVPDNKSGSWVLIAFYGDISNPEAGVLVTFDTSGDNLISVNARCFGNEITKYLVDNCQEWLKQGNWYTSEELIQSEDDFDISATQVSKINISDMNKFLIETAIQMNTLFYQDLISDDVKAYVTQSDDINYNYKNIEEIAASTNDFDIGIIIPANTATYYSTEYPLSTWSLSNLSNNIVKLCPLPKDWIEDVSVILGSQHSNCYAKVTFISGVDIFDNNILNVGYESIPIVGAEKFMKGFTKDKVTYDSPYGDWTEYAGIQNIKYVEAEIDPDDYYDYLLCKGEGYSLVAKQVESVTEVTEYIGVISDSFEWVVPLSIDTPFNPHGKIIRISYDSYENRCEELAGHIRYAGDGVFIYVGHSNAGNYFGDMLNVENGTWFNPGSYSSTSLQFHDGYFMVATGFSGQNKVKIISATGDIKETNIFCQSHTFIGQYSEGLFFAYDGFYDLDCNKVIDLSEYAGLIINQPYFVNGQCSLIAENSNGTQYTGIIDTSGAFISEFTKS